MFGLGLLARPSTYLVILLVVASGAAWTFYELHAHDLVRIGRLEQTIAAKDAEIAQANAAIARWEKEAQARTRAAETALAAAQQKAAALERKMNEILQLPQPTADACQAALELSRRLLLERRAH